MPFSSRRRRSVSILRCWYTWNDAAAAQAVFELLLCLQVALPGLLQGKARPMKHINHPVHRKFVASSPCEDLIH